jgi:hypothetical protein
MTVCFRVFPRPPACARYAPFQDQEDQDPFEAFEPSKSSARAIKRVTTRSRLRRGFRGSRSNDGKVSPRLLKTPSKASRAKIKAARRRQDKTKTLQGKTSRLPRQLLRLRSPKIKRSRAWQDKTKTRKSRGQEQKLRASRPDQDLG